MLWSRWWMQVSVVTRDYPAILLSITPSASPLLGHRHHFIIPRINPHPTRDLAADELRVTSKSDNQQNLSSKQRDGYFLVFHFQKIQMQQTGNIFMIIRLIKLSSTASWPKWSPPQYHHMAVTVLGWISAVGGLYTVSPDGSACWPGGVTQLCDPPTQGTRGSSRSRCPWRDEVKVWPSAALVSFPPHPYLEDGIHCNGLNISWTRMDLPAENSLSRIAEEAKMAIVRPIRVVGRARQ